MERLELYRGEHPEGAVEAPFVVPVDPAGRRVLDVCEGSEGPAVEDGRADAFGLKQAVYAFHKGVIERVPDGPDRGRDALEVEVLGVANGRVLGSGIAVTDQNPR